MKQAFIFDLDGVIADTARYHYQAWKEVARSLGFDFSEQEGERLKGVSRMESLEIMLQAGNITGMQDDDKKELAAWKNRIYLKSIRNLSPLDILPGIPEFLGQIQAEGYGIALGSASRSGGIILENLGLRPLFDVVVDGRSITRAKPDPEIFLKAAEELAVAPEHCIVVEDAAAGIAAAGKGGMHCIGIGSEETLKGAELILEHTGLLARSDYRSLVCRTIDRRKA